MGKIFIGVVIGFIIWTILWLGSDAVILKAAPHLAPNDELSNIPSAYLVIKLISSIIISIISGYIAVLAAKEISKTTLILGVLLLLTGIFFQAAAWNQIPLWYHIIFLILLIPMTVIGGKLKRL